MIMYVAQEVGVLVDVVLNQLLQFDPKTGRLADAGGGSCRSNCVQQRDKVSLDVFWLRDESLEDAANLPEERDHRGPAVGLEQREAIQLNRSGATLATRGRSRSAEL